MKYTANIDVKVSVWQRLQISFNADSKEHAKILIKYWEGVPEDREVNYESVETLCDTEERLTKIDNGGNKVFEIFNIQENS